MTGGSVPLYGSRAVGSTHSFGKYLCDYPLWRWRQTEMDMPGAWTYTVGFASQTRASREYSTSVGSTRSPEGETALLDKDGSRFKVDSVVSDSGTDFYFPSDKTLLSRICELYDPDQTTVQYVNLNPAGEGILFLDGTQEHIVFFYTAFVPGLEKGVLYSAAYVVSAISAERDDIAHPPVEMEVNPDGEINAVTG